AVLLGLLLLSGARAQPPAMYGNSSFGAVLQPGPGAPAPLAVEAPPPAPTAAASWANGIGALPVGQDGPIGSGLYWFTGPSLPVGTFLADNLHAGWMAEVGARTLLFNPSNTAAWTARAGVTFQYNRGDGSAPAINFFTHPVVVRDYFRWAATYGL